MNKATAAKVPGDTCVLGSFISVFSRPRTDPLQQQLWQSHQTSGLPSDWDKKKLAAACRQGVEGAKTFRNVGSTPALLSCDP